MAHANAGRQPRAPPVETSDGAFQAAGVPAGGGDAGAASFGATGLPYTLVGSAGVALGASLFSAARLTRINAIRTGQGLPLRSEWPQGCASRSSRRSPAY
jgi:hypothetical protein